ncbi:hypothetical protein HHK36_018329 [Tetracentron sinense]|uniref:Uncharacterized protein n=1 Tax=Tetracentron sinense TaxID=13715 RepID=A0A834YYI7_TETSI|nr:hypothetical protein HHK36_018329 [Tetracentron sinense]
MLAYGIPADAMDEYVRIGESTSIKYLKRFCLGIITVYEEEYLRSPTEADICRLIVRLRGIDNTPNIYMNQQLYSRQWPRMTCGYDMLFLACLGLTTISTFLIGLICSLSLRKDVPLLPTIPSMTTNTPWDTILRMVSTLKGNPRPNNFSTSRIEETTICNHARGMSEGCEKGIWGAPSTFCYCAGPARFWSLEDLGYIMKTCIILHNMIIKDERDDFLDDEYDGMEVRPPVQVLREPTLPFTEFIARHHMIRSSAVHHTLHNDLIEHFLSREGEQG